MLKIFDTTDKKFLGSFLDEKDVIKDNTITFPGDFLFEIFEVLDYENYVVISNPNYTIFCMKTTEGD